MEQAPQIQNNATFDQESKVELATVQRVLELAQDIDGNIDDLKAIAESYGLDGDDFLGELTSLVEADMLNEENIRSCLDAGIVVASLPKILQPKTDIIILPGQLAKAEKERQPGDVVPYTEFNGRHFTPGVIVRDKNNQLAIVFEVHPIEGDAPELVLRYDNGEMVTTREQPTPVYDKKKLTVKENEPFYDLVSTSLEDRQYKLGQLVTFGNRIGTLAAVLQDGQVLVSALETWGKPSERLMWRIEIEHLDIPVFDEKGSPKRHTDGSLVKPSLDQKL